MTASEAARKLLKHGDPPPPDDDPLHQPYVIVEGPSVSGHHFAAVIWWNPEYKLFEPFDTGHGRYPEREAAVVEARRLASALDLVLR